MKIAFRADGLNVFAAAELARRIHFDGVELAAVANLLTADARAIRSAFAESAIEIAALNIGDEIDALPKRLEFAAAIGCRRIRLKSDPLFSRSGTITKRAIDDLLLAGDVAADFGISILIENQPIAGSMIRLWHLLDRLNHPAIGCIWNTSSAARAEDHPALAIPTLNSRIQHVQVVLDDDQIPAKKTIDRLRGIGFGGYLVLDSKRWSTQNVDELEPSLIQARSQLQQWKFLPAAVG